MEKDLSKQEFISFLKNNKAYKEFRRNFYTPQLINNPFKTLTRKTIIERFSKRKLQSNYGYLFFLSEAFEWEYTTEGWDFWYDVKSRFFVKYF